MKRYVEVTGSGIATQVPDRLDLHVAVTAVEPAVGAALEHVNQRVRALGLVLREHGVADEDLRTTGTSVYEEYGGPEGTRVGYRASHDLKIRVADLDAVPALVAAAVDAVGDDFRLNQLAWGVSDDTATLARARAAAVDDATAKAAELAALVGAAPGQLLRITETSGTADPVGRYVSLAKLDNTAEFAPERGTSQVAVSVHTRWALR